MGTRPNATTPLAATLLGAAAVLLATPAEAQLRPHGAVDGVALLANDGWGGGVTVDLWAPAGPIRVGGALGVAAFTSDDDGRSRALMPVGVSLSVPFGADREPLVDLRLRGGAWGGATNQGLALGGWVAAGVYFGYALGPNVALGAGVSGWVLFGHGRILAIAPSLTLSWLPFEDGMTERPELDEPPAIEVEVVEDRTAGARIDRGFLRLRRLVLRNRYHDGRRSEPYAYDLVERDSIDAVGIVLEAERDGAPWVCLRSALRPPMAFRSAYAIPLAGDLGSPSMWEVPAGLVEPHERGAEGLRACASRETLEEVGLVVPPERFRLLGPGFALSPGVIGEKLYLLHARVEPTERGEPILDGSPTEEGGVVRFVPLAEALRATRDGRIADVKTELALRRLAELRSEA